MGQLDSVLNHDDLETLLESMGDWETIGNHEFHVMNWVKNAQMPPQDSEAYEFMVKIKDQFKQREKEIKDMRMLRQEKAIFLKAKLMLIRRDMGIDQLFDNAARAAAMSPPVPQKETAVQVQPDTAIAVVEEKQDRLAKAEQYIREVGIWNNYQKFLEEQG